MAVYELTPDGIHPVEETTFGAHGIGERADLQRLLRHHVDVLAEDTMILAEEFGTWDDSRRRIDLLALDRDANLVVIELKRGDGALSELQAIRYAAMVSTMTFDQAVVAHHEYLEERQLDGDAQERILEFLDWEEPSDEDFGQAVRILLAAASFPKELTTSVLWLNDNGLDVRCVWVRPYELRGQLLLDVQQVLPLTEASEYQVRVREKVRREREDRSSGRRRTTFDVTIDGETLEGQPKRRAMFAVVKALCDRGVAPDAISAVIDWRGPLTLWRVVEGDVDEGVFRTATLKAAEAGGPRFRPHRWFHADDELIHSGGKTYALTKQLGSPNRGGDQRPAGPVPLP